MERALKRSQDSAGPSNMESANKRLKLAAFKARRDEGDSREATGGRERVQDADTRQVVVFNRDHWVETLD